MSFRNPEIFWVLLVLVPMALLFWVTFRSGKRDLVRIGGQWRAHRLSAAFLLKSSLSSLLILSSVFFVVVAWAGPSWGRSPHEEPQDGLDLALTVDVSRSMTATDASPSRLEQVRETLRLLVSAFPSARFSLVAFAGSARTLTPLTPDKDVLDEWIGELSPDLLSGGGSNLASGLNEAVRTVQFSAVHHRAVILFSDGESRDGDLLGAARSAASQGVVIDCVGFGTADGSSIPDAGGVLRDDFGFPIRTRLVQSNLNMVASETHGQAWRADDHTSLRNLEDSLSTLGNPASRGGVSLEPIPRYQLFVFLALLALVAFVGLRLIPWKDSL